MQQLLAVDDQADAVVFVERDGGGEEEEELRPPVERPALGRLVGGGRGLLAAGRDGNGGFWNSLFKEQVPEVARPLEGELLVGFLLSTWTVENTVADEGARNRRAVRPGKLRFK